MDEINEDEEERERGETQQTVKSSSGSAKAQHTVFVPPQFNFVIVCLRSVLERGGGTEGRK